ESGNKLSLKIQERADSRAAVSPVTYQSDQVSSSYSSADLDTFVASRNSGQFTGRPISIKVRDADLVDVFRLIGEASGFNIIVSDDVKGRVTLSLEDVP